MYYVIRVIVVLPENPISTIKSELTIELKYNNNFTKILSVADLQNLSEGWRRIILFE